MRLHSIGFVCSTLAACALLMPFAHAADVDEKKDWTMTGYDAEASHHNQDELTLDSGNVGSLEVKWIFDDSVAGHEVGPVHATPAVKGGKIFFGTNFGRFYALDPEGHLLWEYETRQPNPLLDQLVIPAPVGGEIEGAVATPVVGGAVTPKNGGLVIFGDLDGNIYALDIETGEEVWVREQLNPHPLGGVVGNALLLVDDMVVIGMSSIENLGLVLPVLGIPYACCTHTGFVVALDTSTGAELWRYETIPAASVGPLPTAFAPFRRGPSGADIWGQPTYDEQTHTVYIGTGQNFSPRLTAIPPFSTARTDSIIALDADTGAEKWARQLTSGDIWVTGIPTPNRINPATGVPAFPLARVGFLDQDFGDSPKVYSLANGTRVVGAGQKSGAYHVLDASTGAVLFSTPHLQQANSLGGFQTGGGFAGDTVFQHGLAGLDATGSGPFNGVVLALSLDGTQEKWRFERFLSPLAGELAIANDVVYVVSPVEETPPALQEFALYALDADSGQVLSRVPLPGRAVSSPVVSRGRIYAGMGNSAIGELGEDETGGLVCFGLPD